MCPLGLVTAKYLSAPVQWFIERWCVLAAVCTRCCSAAVLQAELPRLAASVLSRRSAAAEFTRESRAWRVTAWLWPARLRTPAIMNSLPVSSHLTTQVAAAWPVLCSPAPSHARIVCVENSKVGSSSRLNLCYVVILQCSVLMNKCRVLGADRQESESGLLEQ